MEVLETLPESVRKRTILGEIEREYTLGEIVTITRAAPARVLGLPKKGHLGPGADGDVAIFHPGDDGRRVPKCRSGKGCRRKMDLPRWVIKEGEVIVKNGKAEGETHGKTLHVAPPFDFTVEKSIREHFSRYYTVSFDNYPVQDCYLPLEEEVPCR